jgi:hypothetical protein
MHLLSIRTQSTTRFAREKQLKRWSKIKKVRLIVGINPLGKIFRKGWYPESEGKNNA